MTKIKIIASWLCFFFFSCVSTINSQPPTTNDIIGRWDLVVNKDGHQLPSWLEIYKSGHSTLVGRFVYAFGSARPVSEIKYDGEQFSFQIPPQWEGGTMDMLFEGSMEGDALKGTMRYTDGKMSNWTGTRAPALAYTDTPIWGAPTALFNQKDLTGWKAEGDNQWTVKEGILTNNKAGANLVSEAQFTDFKLHVEFRYPKGSNSGIYLRGRYEVQIEDNHGKAPSSTLFAGVYGFLTPNEMAAKPSGEWQAYDITLVGRRVTIVANGKEVITNQNIPGITGGALDSREGDPGPIFIQGDHGPIEFRSIVITPVIK